MQRERSQTIAVFPVSSTSHLHQRQRHSPHDNGSSIASSSTSPPPRPLSSSSLARLTSLPDTGVSPTAQHHPHRLHHLVHLASPDSDSFRFLSDLVDEPARSILFLPHDQDTNYNYNHNHSQSQSHVLPRSFSHQREDSLSSQFEYVFGGPLNSLHPHRKSRTSSHLHKQPVGDENDPLAQPFSFPSLSPSPSSSPLPSFFSAAAAAKAPAAIDACSFGSPAPLSYPSRYRGGPPKKRKKTLRQRLFSRRNKFVLLSSLVPLFSLALVLITAYASRVHYPRPPKPAPPSSPVHDSYAWYSTSPSDLPGADADQAAYEIDHPVVPPPSAFDIYNPIVLLKGVFFKPRHPAALTAHQRKYTDSRYRQRVPCRLGSEIGPVEPLVFAFYPFTKTSPFFFYDPSYANVPYFFDILARDDFDMGIDSPLEPFTEETMDEEPVPDSDATD